MRGLIRCSLVSVVLLGCVSGPPVWYQGGGSRWSVPMVAPLENDRVVVPVMIEGKGPYLFAVASSGPTMIDRGLAEKLDLYLRSGYAYHDNQDDHLTPCAPFEIKDLDVGDVHLHHIVAWSVRAGSLSYRGQPIHGILGDVLLATTIVADVDRDAGVLRLAVARKVPPPPGAREVGAKVNGGDLYVEAVLGARVRARFIVDLGERTSLLHPQVARALGFSFGGSLERIDETGDHSPIPGYGPPVEAAFGSGVALALRFAGLVDRRYWVANVHGILGDDFLARFRAVLDEDKGKVWLAPRDPDLGARRADRLARWGATFAACLAEGCARVATEPGDGSIVFTRDERAHAESYEVFLQLVGPSGAPVPQPLVRVSFMPGVRAVSWRATAVAAPLAAGSTFRVVDASPFAVSCAGDDCVRVLE